MAAGKGKRMKSEVPKPLVQIAGKSMIEHLLDRVESVHINGKPVVVVSPDGEKLFRSILGDRVELAIQAQQLGTGDAVKSAHQACGDAASILVLYGDHPFIEPKVIARLAELSSRHKDALVMLTTTVPNFENQYSAFKSWSRILRNSDGKIVGDRQVKDASEEIMQIRELNPCIFVFPAEWLWENLNKLNNQNAAEEYYLTDLVKIAVETGMEIVSETVDALQVMGVNTPEELHQAEKYAGQLK